MEGNTEREKDKRHGKMREHKDTTVNHDLMKKMKLRLDWLGTYCIMEHGL